MSLAPEGGAHQSIVTPSIGIEQPGCTAWEPAFGRDLEWTLLHALGRLGRAGGESAYFRLSTRPIDQALAGDPPREARRLAGGYSSAKLLDLQLSRWSVWAPSCQTCSMPPTPRRRRRCHHRHQRRPSLPRLARPCRLRPRVPRDPGSALSPSRAAPIVTVLDGDPHALAFLAGVNATPLTPLGVTRFGQSGDLAEVYEHHEIDAGDDRRAALDLELSGARRGRWIGLAGQMPP